MSHNGLVYCRARTPTVFCISFCGVFLFLEYSLVSVIFLFCVCTPHGYRSFELPPNVRYWFRAKGFQRFGRHLGSNSVFFLSSPRFCCWIRLFRFVQTRTDNVIAMHIAWKNAHHRFLSFRLCYLCWIGGAPSAADTPAVARHIDICTGVFSFSFSPFSPSLSRARASERAPAIRSFFHVDVDFEFILFIFYSGK